MNDSLKEDYSTLDHPEIAVCMFYPRPESKMADTSVFAQDVLIPVDKGINIGARFHMSKSAGGNVVFFHGNGEIVADYDELGPVYNRMGINFIAVDYRGYGRSNGTPGVSWMLNDSHAIFRFIRQWLKTNGYTGPLIIMGRSLGSASALELAACYNRDIGGLIIESGFAYTLALLKVLGVRVASLKLTEENGFHHLEKIRVVDRPVLIIHAEWDHIIPFRDAQALYDACGAEDKQLLKIPEANHNDILSCGFTAYMGAVKKITDKAIHP